jgi:hypothetical protein
MEGIQVDSVCMDTDCGHSSTVGHPPIFTFSIPGLFLVVPLFLNFVGWL